LLGLDHSTIVKWMSSGDDVTKPSEKIGDSPKTKLKGTVYNVWGFTIKRYRKELEAAGELEPITERLGADGKVYSVVSSEIPASEIAEPDPFESVLPSNHKSQHYHQLVTMLFRAK